MLYDVVVIGAGPVGLMLAGELRLAGADVLVVERRRDVDPATKTTSINAATIRALKQRGLARGLADHERRNMALAHMFFAEQGMPIPDTDRPLIAGHFAGIGVPGSLVDFGDPDFCNTAPGANYMMITQQQLEELLAAWTAELDVPIRRGTELVDFEQQGDSVDVRLDTGSVRTRWLVGCDGGRSTVRKLARFDFLGMDPEILGRQALVSMSRANGLRPGWNYTDSGVYGYGPVPGRLVTVEFGHVRNDRNKPLTTAELEASIRRVSGTAVVIDGIESATRFTDRTRQATTYRKGRVLLAGDAAHVHSPFGGQGLNLGIGDAVNLGWKLALVADGSAPVELLDTYTTERHPAGAWVLHWSRAQVALMRPDPRTAELRRVMAEFLSGREGATLLAKKLSGLLHTYDMPGDAQSAGGPAPEITLNDGTQLSDHCHDGGGLLVGRRIGPEILGICEPWAGRAHAVETLTTDNGSLPELFLMRPDGYVAWSSVDGSTEGLEENLRRWLGRPVERSRIGA